MEAGIRTYSYGGRALWRQELQGPAGETGSVFLAGIRKAKSAGGGLDGVYDRLAPASRRALEDLKTGRSGMSGDRWDALCRELKDMGVITQAQFDCSRAGFRLAPLVSDGRGGVTVPTIVKEFLEGGRPGGGDWKGDPLGYLEEWIEALREARSRLSAERWPDGEEKYKDLSALTRQIDDCQKVADILRELLAL